MPDHPECRNCDLWTDCRHVGIGGRERVWGNPVSLAPSILVLGEAPGYQEDVAGEPFVGASGKLLNDKMRLVGIDWAFVTNVVRCMPTDKLPKKSVGLCAVHLDEELDIIQPTHVLALGATAFQRMGGKGAITEQAGKEFWSERYACWVMPTLHPAAILRAPGRDESWTADLYHFANLVKDGQAKLPDVQPVFRDLVVSDAQNVHALARLIGEAETITYDFEATPIPWWHKNWKPYSVSFYLTGFVHAAGHVAVLPLEHPESPWLLTEHGPYDKSATLLGFFRDVRTAMQDPGRVKVTHNDIYDAPVWSRVAGYYPHTTCDTMALAHLLDENRPKSLKWLGRSLLGWPDWDIDAKKEHPLVELAKYNALDAYATYLLREKLLAELAEDEHRLRYFASIVMPSIRAVGRMMVRGIYVDRDVLDERLVTCRENIATTRAQIPVENPNSSQQIAAWLYGPTTASGGLPPGLGLPVLKLTPGGAPSTDEATINLLAQKHPEVRKVLEHRRWVKNDSTYLAPANELITTSTDGRAHFDYRSTSVETGRYGSRFHTQPRDPFVRSIYSAPPGWTLLSADFSNIELRLVAWAAAGKPATWEDVDPARSPMLTAIHDGLDVYIETAASALHKSYADVTTKGANSERQMMGKVPSLAMIYRISAKGFREYAWNQFEIEYSEAEAERLWSAFYSRWPEIRAWHSLEEKLIRARGYAQNPLGRIRHLPEVFASDRKIQEEAIRAGINAPIQGCASNILDAAHVYLDAALRDKPAHVVGIVHDDLLVEVRDDVLDALCKIVPVVMTQAVPQLLRGLGLHLPPGLLKVEQQVGPWGSGRLVG